MTIRFETIGFEDLKQRYPSFLAQYVTSLSHPIDSFLEQHIWDAQHYIIRLDDSVAGYCSIYKEGTLTQFFVSEQYRAFSQRIFAEIKHLEKVTGALIPTSDSHFLAHALDNYQRLEKQAYFFQDSENKEKNISELQRSPVQLEMAKPNDLDLVKKLSADFFDQLETRIKHHEIFSAKYGHDTVGFGIIEQGKILTDYASIGMYIVEAYRQQGFGSWVLRHLKGIVYNQGRKPTAGCWYYNHNSKKTLQKAGMQTSVRLMRFYF